VDDAATLDNRRDESFYRITNKSRRREEIDPFAETLIRTYYFNHFDRHTGRRFGMINVYSPAAT
jgi:hypothetical protein